MNEPSNTFLRVPYPSQLFRSRSFEVRLLRLQRLESVKALIPPGVMEKYAHMSYDEVMAKQAELEAEYNKREEGTQVMLEEISYVSEMLIDFARRLEEAEDDGTEVD